MKEKQKMRNNYNRRKTTQKNKDAAPHTKKSQKGN